MANEQRFTPDAAFCIISAIMEDIRGRPGIGNEFEALDTDVLDEISAAWRAIILDPPGFVRAPAAIDAAMSAPPQQEAPGTKEAPT